MKTDKSFPPIDDAIVALSQVDYKKLYERIREFLITLVAVMMAVYTVAKELWIKHNCNQRTINGAIYVKQSAIVIKDGAIVSYKWIRESLIPGLVELYRDALSIYNVFRGNYI